MLRPRTILLRFLLAGCWLLGAVLFSALALGYERYVITGGSMTGTYGRGTLLLAKPTRVADLKVGNVITYTPPRRTGAKMLTHRIMWIGKDRAGVRAFRTKGDFNATPDPWMFTMPDKGMQPRAAIAIPYLGWLFAALGLRWVRLLFIGLPAFLLGAVTARRLWREPDPGIA